MKQKTLCILVLILVNLLNSCAPATAQPSGGEISTDEEAVQPTDPQSQEAGAEEMNLSANDLIFTPPQDIFDEIGYFGGMGGGEDCTMYNYQSPSIVLGTDTDDLRPMGEIFIYACGLPAIGENVHITVVMPNNASKDEWQASRQTAGQNYGEVEFIYKTALRDPIGRYYFLFEGDGWSTDTTVDISSPNLVLEGNKLIFLSFEPNENIRLLVYAPDINAGSARLIGWKEVQVDSQGQLIINIDFSEVAFAAIGERSGEIHFNYWEGLGPILKTEETGELISTPTVEEQNEPIPTSTEPVSDVDLGEWMIIVGAGFSSYDTARQALQKYEQFGYPVQVFYRETYIRTAIIGFSTQSDAESTLQSVQAINPQAYVRSVSEWCPVWTGYPDHVECN